MQSSLTGEQLTILLRSNLRNLIAVAVRESMDEVIVEVAAAGKYVMLLKFA